MKNKNPFLQKLKNNIIYFFIVGLISTVRLTPRSISLFFARILGDGFYYIFAGERKKVESNLLLAFGNSKTLDEIKAIGRKVFVNIAQNLVDVVLQNKLLSRKADSIMPITGLEIAKAALEKKRGIIFLTAHTGCFEMLSPRISMLGFPVTVLGTKIYDPRINRLIIKNRKNFNVEYIERGEDLRPLLKSLHSGNAFGVLCDLDTRVESRFIDFFGMPAKTPVGPFKLGVKYDIPIIPIFARRTDDGCQEVTVFPEISLEGDNSETRITSAMQQYNRVLEQFIKQDPTQWIWMHERWKSKP